MGIERGAEWGTATDIDPTWPSVSSDAELVGGWDPGHRPAGPVWLVGGDLAKTLGVDGRPPRSHGRCTLVGIDAIAVRLDAQPPAVAAAHVLIGGRGPVPDVAVMNAAFVGTANLAPRAHPGDGLVDIVEFKLKAVDRLKARRRFETGTHLPHPDIVSLRRPDWSAELSRSSRVIVDGVDRGRARQVSVKIVPGALTVAI